MLNSTIYIYIVAPFITCMESMDFHSFAEQIDRLGPSAIHTNPQGTDFYITDASIAGTHDQCRDTTVTIDVLMQNVNDACQAI